MSWTPPEPAYQDPFAPPEPQWKPQLWDAPYPFETGSAQAAPIPPDPTVPSPVADVPAAVIAEPPSIAEKAPAPDPAAKVEDLVAPPEHPLAWVGRRAEEQAQVSLKMTETAEALKAESLAKAEKIRKEREVERASEQRRQTVARDEVTAESNRLKAMMRKGEPPMSGMEWGGLIAMAIGNALAQGISRGKLRPDTFGQINQVMQMRAQKWSTQIAGQREVVGEAKDEVGRAQEMFSTHEQDYLLTQAAMQEELAARLEKEATAPARTEMERIAAKHAGNDAIAQAQKLMSEAEAKAMERQLELDKSAQGWASLEQREVESRRSAGVQYAQMKDSREKWQAERDTAMAEAYQTDGVIDPITRKRIGTARVKGQGPKLQETVNQFVDTRRKFEEYTSLLKRNSVMYKGRFKDFTETQEGKDLLTLHKELSSSVVKAAAGGGEISDSERAAFADLVPSPKSVFSMSEWDPNVALQKYVGRMDTKLEDALQSGLKEPVRDAQGKVLPNSPTSGFKAAKAGASNEQADQILGMFYSRDLPLNFQKEQIEGIGKKLASGRLDRQEVADVKEAVEAYLANPPSGATDKELRPYVEKLQEQITGKKLKKDTTPDGTLQRLLKKKPKPKNIIRDTITTDRAYKEKA